MHKIITAFSVLALSSIASAAFPAEVMYCTDNENEHYGFSNDKNYGISRFVEERHTIKFTDDLKQLVIGYDEYQCQKPYKPDYDEIVCQQKSGYTFIFNPISKKYIKFECSVFSYTSNGSDTCTVAQGTCVHF